METEEPNVKKKKQSAKSIQPDWSNPPSQADLDADYISAESGQDTYRSKLEEWNVTRDGGPEIPGKAVNRSKARPKVVRKHNEWKYPALEEPFLSSNNLFRVSPATHADTEAAEQNGKVLNYQWNTKINKTSLVTDIVRVVVDDGTVITKTGWEVETEIQEVEKEVPVYATAEESILLMRQAVESGQMPPEQAQAMLETGEALQVGTKIEIVEEEVLTKNQPTYEVCVTADVTVDPTCNGVVADALFVIHEYDTSYADLKSDEHGTEEDGEEYGIYYNLDYIVPEDGDTEYNPALSEESNDFEFQDKARKRLKAYEYWGYWDIQGDGTLVSIVATWIGKTLIRLEENPFPHGRIPFSVATYMPVKNSVHGEPDAELLRENQDSIGKMTRAIHDITARQAVGQEFIDENLFPSPSQKNAYEKGGTVYIRSGFDAAKAIHRKDVQAPGSAPFDVIAWQANDANELTGNKPFGDGNSPRMGGDQQSRDSMDATAKRELSILRRLSNLLFVDMGRMTVSMNQAFLSEEEVIRVTDREFVTISRDDLQGDFDLRVQVSTPERDADQATKIMKLLQTNAASMDPEITKMHYVQLAKLWQLDTLAEAVATYEPQPDPAQQEMVQLQLEEQRLKNANLMAELDDTQSKIAERISRASENSGDKALDAAKTEQALAVTEKVKSETDVIDASFLYLQSGQKRQDEIDDQEYTAQVDAAKEQQKAVTTNATNRASDVRQAELDIVKEGTKSDLEMAREQFKRASHNVAAKTVAEI